MEDIVYFIRAKRKVKEFLNIGSKPDFLILGVQKSGTTSLFKYLEMYGENFKAPVKKEIQFFTENYYRGYKWYYSHFPLLKRGEITGEASPTYLFYKNTPKYLKSSNIENPKFIVILRDPVDRAYSHYNFNFTDRNNAIESYSFIDALKNEESRVDIDSEVFTYENKHYSYKSRGLYYKQLQNWFQYFEQDRFLVLELSEFEKNTKEQLKNVFDFLGIQPNSNFETANFEKFNSSTYNKMPEETENYLVNYFREENKKLFKLLGVCYDWKT